MSDLPDEIVERVARAIYERNGNRLWSALISWAEGSVATSVPGTIGFNAARTRGEEPFSESREDVEKYKAIARAALRECGWAEMKEALEKTNGIIIAAQSVLAEYLPPDGMSQDEAVNMLLGILDGPDQRDAQSACDAALSKARGET